MGDHLLQWLLTLVLLGCLATLYWQNRATTYRTVDGACQSLTVEDECD
jgi:hypothetical protein